MDRHLLVNKYISIIKRCSNPFFDRQLAEYGIGSGQQFFLLHIKRNPGASFHELAHYGGYDKATSTRAVKKLMEEGYVRLEVDSVDKRVRHLYVTEKAQPVVSRTEEMLEEWNGLITRNFTMEEKLQAEALLKRMAENANGGAVDAIRHKGEL